MQPNSNTEDSSLKEVKFLTGTEEIVRRLARIPAKEPFCEQVTEYLNCVSRLLMKTPEAKAYSDVITFAFWIRKANTEKLKERFSNREGYHLGRGMVFHIAPSNVPVNFAYSLMAGLLMGNANVVRVPSKDFPQVTLLIAAFNEALKEYEELRNYMVCVRYERNKEINDWFSKMADVRIVWGGDQTIAELRKSPLPPRAGEISFADRYSIAIIDSDCYMDTEDKRTVAENFYNDTFFSDQNACTSPRIVVWMGQRIEEAKKLFWETEHELVKEKYSFQPIQGVNKLTQSYLIAVAEPGVRIIEHEDNLIVRIQVPEVTETLMEYRDNSGYFYEYNCKDIMEIRPICADSHCQTVAYLGDRDMVLPLIKSGVKGIDRVVPIGKTMDFDMIWDGYDLPAALSRVVMLQ